MEWTGDENLGHELHLLFDYKPEPLAADPSAESLTLAPLSFYDKHVDQRLALNRIVINALLPLHLSEPVERVLKDVKEQEISLPRVLPKNLFPALEYCTSQLEEGPAIDARFVAEAYGSAAGYFGPRIASMFSLHINCPKWLTVLRWIKVRKTRERDFYSLDEAFAPELLFAPSSRHNVLDSIDEALQRDLKETQKRFPRLATWQVLCATQEAEGVLRAMDDLATPEMFPFRQPLTTGYKVTDEGIPRSQDALMTPWGVSVASYTAAKIPVSTTVDVSVDDRIRADDRRDTAPRRSSRILAKHSVKKDCNDEVKKPGKNSRKTLLSPETARRHQAPEWTSVVLPSLDVPSGHPSSVSASLIQHAWVCAVEDDSTFIVLHSGNFERIGFRHRATGTLFLSEMIDATKCTDPAYGKTHIGLFMSIIEDALQRVRQQVEQEQLEKATRKRRLSISECASRKRPKTRAYLLNEAAIKLQEKQNFENILEKAGSRDLALIRIQKGVFNSPAPASFLRVGRPSTEKKSYAPAEYLTVTIGSEIATGATGACHTATVELPTSDGTTLRHDNIVIKLAFDVEPRKRLRHEFAVYQHLMASKVKGIPTILGLFQDVETRTLALVMNNVGVCVLDRQSRRNDINFVIPQSQRAAFVDVIKNIHGAGVRHRDIRPENMVVDGDGAVAIIDFDRADLDASEGSREREFQHLLDLLNGKYYPPGDMPSLRSHPRSHSPLESSVDGTE